MRTTTELQQRLIKLKYLPDPDHDTGLSSADGTFGTKSVAAYNRWRAAQPIPLPPVIRPTMAQLNADLFPEEQPASPLPKPSIFSSLATIGDLLALLKGRTMTTDQITGIVRLVLGLIAGYFVTKGIGSQSLWDWISAGVLTAIPAIWSWYSNRPKVILPISQK